MSNQYHILLLNGVAALIDVEVPHSSGSISILCTGKREVRFIINISEIVINFGLIALLVYDCKEARVPFGTLLRPNDKGEKNKS